MSEEGSTNGSVMDRLKGALAQALTGVPRDREKLIEILRLTESNHLIDPETLNMLEGAMQVSLMQVRDIMIPASEMSVIQEDDEPADFLQMVTESGHSRFPVIDENRKVLGILLAKDLLSYLAQDSGGRFNIRDVMRSPVFVPESKRLNVLLREFRSNRNHLAVVIDEYGETSGLVTIEDVLEQIVGDIDDEHDIDEDDFIKEHRDHRYTVKARTPIEDFNDYFNTDLGDEEYETVGGLVTRAFGHLPQRGESVDFAGFNFKIISADKRRILLMRMVRLQDDQAADEG